MKCEYNVLKRYLVSSDTIIDLLNYHCNAANKKQIAGSYAIDISDIIDKLKKYHRPPTYNVIEVYNDICATDGIMFLVTTITEGRNTIDLYTDVNCLSNYWVSVDNKIMIYR